ncbi:unnamed protein product [Pleuronectes platessa]|uniref:Uncharacterized protein n=1 Tax=Pleuronectes platessa TaxID=8262 RepID=A0A9N7UXS0_PLEPL|nr:unnamed protein product [Pleuronectes platessa]
MAEFGEDGRLPPLHLGDSAVPLDEAAAAGKTHCEVSILNGDCGISDNMVGSPGACQAGLEAANTSVGPADAKHEIPRRSSIIKDGSRHRKERKKTVSFSSMPTEKKISSASDCINAMVDGSELKKVRSNSRIYHRYFSSMLTCSL